MSRRSRRLRPLIYFRCRRCTNGAMEAVYMPSGRAVPCVISSSRHVSALNATRHSRLSTWSTASRYCTTAHLLSQKAKHHSIIYKTIPRDCACRDVYECKRARDRCIYVYKLYTFTNVIVVADSLSILQSRRLQINCLNS